MTSPLITNADRLAMLTDMGESVALTNGQESTDTYGVLSRRYVEVDGVESRYPTILVATHTLPLHEGTYIERGDTLVVNAGSFTVIGVHPDPDGDEGFTLLVLQEGDE